MAINIEMEYTTEDTQRQTPTHCMQLLPDEQMLLTSFVVCTIYVLVVYTLTINNMLYINFVFFKKIFYIFYILFIVNRLNVIH